MKRFINIFPLFLCLIAVLLLNISCGTKKAMIATEDAFNPKEHDQILRRTTLVVRDINKSLSSVL